MAWSLRCVMRWQLQSGAWTRNAVAMLTQDAGDPWPG